MEKTQSFDESIEDLLQRCHNLIKEQKEYSPIENYIHKSLLFVQSIREPGL